MRTYQEVRIEISKHHDEIKKLKDLIQHHKKRAEEIIAFCLTDIEQYSNYEKESNEIREQINILISETNTHMKAINHLRAEILKVIKNGVVV